MEINRIADLLRKIKNLADHGIEGEKIAAEKKLADLLDKHNLTLDDIFEAKKKWYDFSFKRTYEKNLILQCYSCVFNSPKISYSQSYKTISFQLTASQYYDLQETYSYYRELLKEELEKFYKAFMIRHNIFQQSGEKSNSSAKDLEDVLMMAFSMSGESLARGKGLLLEANVVKQID